MSVPTTEVASTPPAGETETLKWLGAVVGAVILLKPKEAPTANDAWG